MSVGDRKVEIASVEDAQTIAELINKAYSVENGNTGVAFKKDDSFRLSDPLESWFAEGYQTGRILKVVDHAGVIYGVIYYELHPEEIYFGPFAVKSECKGQGVGKLLLNEINQIGFAKGLKNIVISVVDWRTDVIPMYENMGYVKQGEKPYPHEDQLTRPSRMFIYRKPIVQPTPTVTPTVVLSPISVPAATAQAKIGFTLGSKRAPAVMKELPSAGAAGEKSAWASINNMLVQNRCWLCEQVFPRGKQKKVFQVSNLLDFFNERLKVEDGVISAPPSSERSVVDSDSAMDVVSSEPAAANTTNACITNSNVVAVAVPELLSRNLRNCYTSFCAMVRADPTGEKNLMRKEFAENDVEVWMSGLACGLSPECVADLQLFITTTTGGGGSGSSNKTSVFGNMGKDDKDCPPGCGCDNPWPFLS